MNYTVDENEKVKVTRAKGYNAVFRKADGYHARWGATPDEDPGMAPCPEILDMEIATACDGIPGIDQKVASPCVFCYKSNKRQGEDMSFETFQCIFQVLPKTITQVAFGIGSLRPLDHDMWKIFDYTRANGVVPNITING